MPLSTIDWEMTDGIKQIPIEQRDVEEVKYIEGWHNNQITKVRLTPENCPAVNYGFDVTPAKYVMALITEKGVCKAIKEEIKKLRNF